MYLVQWTLESCKQKDQGPNPKDEKVISLFITDRQILWLIEDYSQSKGLIEVLYAIKRDVLWFIGA